jgi:hypothetical protein
MPPSSMTAAQAWRDKTIRLKLLGRKHINGAAFTECFDLEITSLTGTLSMADLVRDSLASVESQTDIPADLLEGLSLQLIANSPQG